MVHVDLHSARWFHSAHLLHGGEDGEIVPAKGKAVDDHLSPAFILNIPSLFCFGHGILQPPSEHREWLGWLKR